MPNSTCFDPIKFQIAFRSVLLKLFDVTYRLFFFLLLFQRARDWRAKEVVVVGGAGGGGVCVGVGVRGGWVRVPCFLY